MNVENGHCNSTLLGEDVQCTLKNGLVKMAYNGNRICQRRLCHDKYQRMIPYIDKLGTLSKSVFKILNLDQRPWNTPLNVHTFFQFMLSKSKKVFMTW